MFPISFPTAAGAISPTPEVESATAAPQATPVAPPDAAPVPSATVEFSTVAQFLSSVTLSRRQLLELQGEADTEVARQPVPQELAVLDAAARNLSNAFNNLQVSAALEASVLADNAGSQSLASRLAQELERRDPAIADDAPLAAPTLAFAGLSLAPVSPGAAQDNVNPAGSRIPNPLSPAETAPENTILDAPVPSFVPVPASRPTLPQPAPRALLVDTQTLATAFTQDRNRTLSVLDNAAQRFAALGDEVARQAASDAAARAEASTVAAERIDQAEAAANRLFQENREIEDRQRELATDEDRRLDTVRQLANEQLADTRDEDLAETQADRLTARQAATVRQLGSSMEEDLAATALAGRMEVQREEAQRLATAAGQPQADARARATDPATAAAIAAYNLGSAAFAAAQARPNPAPPIRSDKVGPATPVTPVKPLQTAGQTTGDAAEPRR